MTTFLTAIKRRASKTVAATMLAGSALLAGSTVAAAAPPAPAAGGCDAYHANVTYPLQRCDKGIAVEVLQFALRDTDPTLRVDGYFGIHTERALIDYMQRYGLPVAATVNAHIWHSLVWKYDIGDDINASGTVDPWEVTNLPGRPPTTSPSPEPPPAPICAAYRADYAYPIQICGRGEAVKMAQLVLGCTVAPGLVPDRYFGPLTWDAVLTYQQAMRLPITGQIDRETWTAMTHGHVYGTDSNGNGIIDSTEVVGALAGHLSC